MIFRLYILYSSNDHRSRSTLRNKMIIDFLAHKTIVLMLLDIKSRVY
jgi:hypothetical protein